MKNYRENSKHTGVRKFHSFLSQHLKLNSVVIHIETLNFILTFLHSIHLDSRFNSVVYIAENCLKEN